MAGRPPSAAEATHTKGVAIAALGVLILAPDTLLLRVIEADAFTVAFWRNLLVATNILVLYAAVEGPGWFAKLRHIGPAGLLAAALFAVNQMAFVFAVANTGVANVLLIVATAPLFAALFSRVFLREATARRTWLAIVGALAGMAVIFGGEAGLLGGWGGGPGLGTVGPDPLLGNLCALAVAIALGGAFTVVRHRREVTSLPSMVLAGYFSAFAMIWFASPFAMDSVSFGWQVTMGLMVACAFALIATAPRFAPSPVVSLMLLLETVLGPLLVWSLLAEVPSRWALLGGAIVLTALLGQGFGELLAQRRHRRERLRETMKSADSRLGYQAGE
ncbi:DMT family transporter [Algihabitans albus]|uniref:DMT family transporter n=1 Tax=Algihabitans albus TaxID=2164067 RepID=UPI000E5CF85B|nr:DMT family transporter [Algihabitans albus]